MKTGENKGKQIKIKIMFIKKIGKLERNVKNVRNKIKNKKGSFT